MDLDDPRVYLAVERTFLAWVRTGLALMGFGFVVARFGLFLREMAKVQGATSTSHGISAHFGTVLIGLGALLTMAAVFRYVRLLRRLRQNELLTAPSRLAIVTGVALAAIGLVVSAYLILISW